MENFFIFAVYGKFVDLLQRLTSDTIFKLFDPQKNT